MKCLTIVQRALLIFGLTLIMIYIAAYTHKTVLSRAQLRRFEAERGEPVGNFRRDWWPPTFFPVDLTLWSEKRVAAYQDSLLQSVAPPLALLRIPRLRLEVPVLEGTDDLTLNRGIGHIAGTSLPGQEGNIGIAGHRDGFFRVLKDVAPGDEIELVTREADETYVVDQIVLVNPDDVSVLRPRSKRSLTLVTCYPFYFIGSAPQRYIVQATVVNSGNSTMARSSLSR
jgi:sortase A